MDLVSARKEERELTVDLGATGEIRLAYQPNLITDELLQSVARDDVKASARFSEMLRKLAEEETEATPAGSKGKKKAADDTAEVGVVASVERLALSKVLLRWDVTEAGEPVPVTLAGLRRVPIWIIHRVWAEIGEDQSPNPLKPRR